MNAVIRKAILVPIATLLLAVGLASTTATPASAATPGWSSSGPTVYLNKRETGIYSDVQNVRYGLAGVLTSMIPIAGPIVSGAAVVIAGTMALAQRFGFCVAVAYSPWAGLRTFWYRDARCR